MQNSDKLISANSLLEKVQFRVETKGVVSATVRDMVDITRRLIDEAPAVDAAEVVHGRWKPYHEADIGYDEYGVRCSNCGFEVEDHEVKFNMHYCPNCGAKMDGGKPYC